MQSLNRRYVPELDHLRAFAALLVLLYHTSQMGWNICGPNTWPKGNIISGFVMEGHTGVALFMVLSGFVLSRGVLGKNVDYRNFIQNRILRIFPLLTIFVVFALYSSNLFSVSAAVSNFMFMANTRPRLFDDPSNLTATTWTISVEFQFYLIAPFIFTFLSRRGIRYLIALMIFMALVRLIAYFPHRGNGTELYDISYYTIIGRINQFLFGVCLAQQWERIQASPLGSRKAGAAAVLVGGLLALAHARAINLGGGIMVWHPWMIVQPEIEAAIWTLIIGGYVIAKPLDKLPRLSLFLSRLGLVSFGIYLVHYSIGIIFWREVVAHGLGPKSITYGMMFLYALAAVPISVFLAGMSYITIEKPFLELRKRYV